MTKSIEYRTIPKDSEEFLEAVDFAEEFDHKIVAHPQVNVTGFYKDGKLFGYADHVFIPTIYPAFHPGHTKPRDVLQVMQDYRAFAQLSGSLGFCGVPLESERPTFTNEIMAKLGLTRMHRELYSY